MGIAAGRRVEVARPRDAIRELSEALWCARPVVTDAIAITAVPFGPLRRKVADLIATVTNVPWLGDQLHPADDRILLDEIEERGQPIDFMHAAGERRGEVEAKTVDVHL